MITLPENFISDILDICKNMFSDILPLILAVLGISIGFWIIKRLIYSIPGNDWYTKGGFEDDSFLTEEDKEYYRSKLEDE